MGSRVLFFGRFQPFHKGHLEALKWLLARWSEVVVAVGMASESHTWRNPFTAGERVWMIMEGLRSEGVDCSRVVTVTIPTLEVSRAAAYTVLTYSPPVDAVASANPLIRPAFEELGVEVVEPPLVEREKLSSERIRRLIAAGDPEWRSLVPSGTARVIEAVGGPRRLRMLARALGEAERLIDREST